MDMPLEAPVEDRGYEGVSTPATDRQHRSITQKPRLDVKTVKTNAMGRWPFILAGLGVSPAIMDGKPHPCPSCGGKDRFRFDDLNGEGTYFCNQCGSGDGFSLAGKMLGLDPRQDFPALLERVDELCTTEPRSDWPKNRRTTSPDHQGKNVSWRVVTPIPSDATPPPSRHYRHGVHTREWIYRDVAGRPLFHVRRFDKADESKTILPLTYCRSSEGDSSWRWKGVDVPRPLYNLDHLAENADARVLICEGEKAADAAKLLFPEYVVTTSPNGSGGTKQADWSSLQSRRVIIWPDADESGVKYADSVAEVLHGTASSVRLVQVPDDFPPGWDLADEPPPEWDIEKLRDLLDAAKTIPPPCDEEPGSPFPSIKDRPCYRIYDKAISTPDGRWIRQGVYWHGVRQGRDGEEEQNAWICGPLYVDAQSSDAGDSNFGRLLRFRDSRGCWKKWCLPMELMGGSGEEMRRELLNQGLEINAQDRHHLSHYIQWETPKSHVLAATQTGWCQDAFVLPDEVIGGQAAIVFQSPTKNGREYACSGSLDGWKQEVAALAVGNPLLAMFMSTAFVGPLLKRVHRDGGGVHSFGDSSSGKSTALKAAASVWGGREFIRSWRGTANGMEGAACLFNDNLLALDEIGESDPREIGRLVYLLANGYGKQRANRYGGAREVIRWQAILLSTGERTLSAHMAEGGRESKAGQEVRLLDIPVARRYGLFDNLHSFQDGRALSDALQEAVARHHGHAGRAYLRKLVADTRTDFGRRLASMTEEFFNLPQADGQERRAAGRFALIALAGELATEYGITGWPKGTALEAAQECFQIWGNHRGRGNAEERAILERVSDALDRHGDSRFSRMDEIHEVRDRLGWTRVHDKQTEYLFSHAGLKEVTVGFDFRRALKALEDAGWLRVAASKNAEGRSVQVRINGVNTRVYPVIRLAQ